MKSKESIRKSAQTEIIESYIESGLTINSGDLDNRIPTAIRLSTTKEEFLLYLFENSYMRPNFLLNEDRLEIPVFFVKADKNSQDFISDIRERYRIDPGKMLMLSGFHILKREPADIGSIPDSVINSNGTINTAIANQLDEIAKIKPKKREVLYRSVESILSYKNENPLLVEISDKEIFAYCFKENEKVLKMFNESHYEDTPPKCVITDTNKSELNPCSIVRLLLMHMLSFDIIVASYKSYSSIENYFPDNSYDVHYFEGSEQDFSPLAPKKNLYPLLLWFLFGAVIIYSVLHWGIKLF